MLEWLKGLPSGVYLGYGAGVLMIFIGVGMVARRMSRNEGAIEVLAGVSMVTVGLICGVASLGLRTETRPESSQIIGWIIISLCFVVGYLIFVVLYSFYQRKFQNVGVVSLVLPSAVAALAQAAYLREHEEALLIARGICWILTGILLVNFLIAVMRWLRWRRTAARPLAPDQTA